MSRPRLRCVPQEGHTERWQVQRWVPIPFFPWYGEWVRDMGYLTREQADKYAAHQMQPPHYYGSEAAE